MNTITIFLPINRKICYPTQEKRLLKEFYLTQLSQYDLQSPSFFCLLSSGTLHCSMTWKTFPTARSLYQMDQLDASWLVKGSCNKDCTKFPLSGATWPDCQLRDLQRGLFIPRSLAHLGNGGGASLWLLLTNNPILPLVGNQVSHRGNQN